MDRKKDQAAAWSGAGLADDFVFGAVMQIGDNSLNLLRAIFPQLTIKGLNLQTFQKNIRLSPDGHDVILDVYVEDDQGRIFDVEMQQFKKAGFWSRIWHYLVYLENQALQKGEHYEKRRPVFLAFLMSYDVLLRNKKVYRGQLLFDQQQVPMDTSMVLLNAHGELEEITPELQDVYHLINGNNHSVSTTFGKKLMQDIKRVKLDPEMERKYMIWSIKIEEERAEAWAEGRKEGRKKELENNIFSVAKSLKSQGFSRETIKSVLAESFQSLSAQDLEQIFHQLGY